MRGGDRLGHPTTPQCFDSKRSDPACLQTHARGAQTLQHEDTYASPSQLDCGEKSDRSGSNNHDVDMVFHT